MVSQRSRCTNRMKRWPPITVMLPSAGKSLPKSLCAHSDFFQSFPVRSKRRQQQAPRVWFPSARPFLCSHSECFSLYLSPPQIMSRANTFLDRTVALIKMLLSSRQDARAAVFLSAHSSVRWQHFSAQKKKRKTLT